MHPPSAAGSPRAVLDSQRSRPREDPLRFSNRALSLIGAALLQGGASSAALALHLEHLGTYATGTIYGGGAEISAYDPASQRLFVVNGSTGSLDVVSIADPTHPTLLFSISCAPYGRSANSVAVKDGVVAAAIEAMVKQDPGRVAFFDADGNALGDVQVGALPDMLTFTPDGRYVLVANEGEPDSNYINDPEGSVSMIDLTGGPGAATVTTLSLALPYSEVTDAELRIYGPGSTVAQDLEPEYIAVSPDSRTAWVSLQEANGIAIVDLELGIVRDLVPLGYKDHSLPGNGIDASDRSGVIDIRSWPVFGMYQPDALAAWNAGGADYVLSANEGDARDYAALAEEARVRTLTLDPTVFPDATTLKADNNLGRLTVTTVQGDIDGDADFDALYALGARSVTVWDAEGSLVWDSGDLLEQITAAAYPADFNANNEENGTFKNRSDNKGPEPEGVAIGQVDGVTYGFACLERIGGVVSFDLSDPTSPQFVEYVNHRDFGGSVSLGTALDSGPEGLTFIAAEQSPNGQPLLVVSNEVSGTASLFVIENGGVPAEVTPSVPAAFRAFPNPAVGSTSLAWSAPIGSAAALSIHGADGRQVRTLTSNNGTVDWDGRDDAGRDLPRGAYFARLATDQVIRVIKITLTR
ncbi:MAG: choice-of-anchor I family protein [Candidatus Eisenbacteria bacterium]|nr:choice-of-anchor I family protein [Candidatus Eisenbacteria bacterium]